MCPSCMQHFLQARWSVSLTPLDTCGVTNLSPWNSEPWPFIAVSTPWSYGLGASLLYFCTVLQRELNKQSSPMYGTVATLLTLQEVNHYVEFKTGCPLLEKQHSWFRPVQKISDWCTYQNMTCTMNSITIMSWMLYFVKYRHACAIPLGNYEFNTNYNARKHWTDPPHPE